MTVTAIRKDPRALTMTIDAEFDASPERVWQLWADPRQLERWWGPPTYPATFTRHDLAPGSRVEYHMTGPEGDQPHGYWDIVEAGHRSPAHDRPGHDPADRQRTDADVDREPLPQHRADPAADRFTDERRRLRHAGAALLRPHPGDLRRTRRTCGTLVAHEPPLASILPDREHAMAATRAVHETYQRSGWGAAMALFIAVSRHQGPFTAEIAGQPAPDPAMFGLPAEDDGSRTDPLPGQNIVTCTHYEPGEAPRGPGTSLTGPGDQVRILTNERDASLLRGQGPPL
jgi:uncharacterized protein YndB with AHSA1/START domain